jgi:hypothetical protein
MLSSSSRSLRPMRHTLNIACQVVRERDFRLVADRVVDLSLNGMLVAPADPVLTGEKLIVSFASPFSGRWIDAQATVTRVLHGRRPGEFRRALGLEFEVLDAESLTELHDCLRRIPPAPPGARRRIPYNRQVLNTLSRTPCHLVQMAFAKRLRSKVDFGWGLSHRPRLAGARFSALVIMS